MKVLCLHGAYGSAKNFQVQLAPFMGAVGKSDVEFKWINGFTPCKPPPGYDDYFGAPPLYRFIAMDGISELDGMIAKIRDMENGCTPEETIRTLVAEQEQFASPALKKSMAQLLQIIDEDPEIDGILGYSEGATTAATLILEERRLEEEQGRARRLKYAVFFAGWPPVRLKDDRVETLLADSCEDQDILDIPTCHIVGCNDPYIHGAMALYAMCDEDQAILFDHGKGHTVPRDERTIKELSNAIEQTFGMGDKYVFA